uniref:Uncharacterized protein n=1 Tax=Timema monikensis TaxID=170555 RepID=A0A7R9EAF9_9NEOP|nr:unnamed protein product [Timema monikensis]
MTRNQLSQGSDFDPDNLAQLLARLSGALRLPAWPRWRFGNIRHLSGELRGPGTVSEEDLGHAGGGLVFKATTSARPEDPKKPACPVIQPTPPHCRLPGPSSTPPCNDVGAHPLTTFPRNMILAVKEEYIPNSNNHINKLEMI